AEVTSLVRSFVPPPMFSAPLLLRSLGREPSQFPKFIQVFLRIPPL
ncbi:hypothetical protein Tco_0634419, partial [Tanacetum coccineum]